MQHTGEQTDGHRTMHTLRNTYTLHMRRAVQKYGHLRVSSTLQITVCKDKMFINLNCEKKNGILRCNDKSKKGKGLPYSLPSVGPGARCTGSQLADDCKSSTRRQGRLPLLSIRPAVTFPAAEHHRLLAGTNSYCLVTEAHKCKQPAQCFSCNSVFAAFRVYLQ